MCKYVLLHHASVEGCVELVHCCPLVSWAHIQCPICIVNTRNANILASVTKRIQDLQEKVLRSCVKTVSITVIILVSAPHHQCNNFWQNISRKLEGEWSCQVLQHFVVILPSQVPYVGVGYTTLFLVHSSSKALCELRLVACRHWNNLHNLSVMFWDPVLTVAFWVYLQNRPHLPKLYHFGPHHSCSPSSIQ